MNDELKRITKKLQEDFPHAFRLAYPRQIQPPAGYCNPVYYSTLMIADIIAVLNPNMRMLSHLNGYMSALLLMDGKMPTYFISQEFAEAVANTDLPGDFKFAELKWPMPSQLFVLPDKFVMQYFNSLYCPFLAVSKGPNGPYPHRLGPWINKQEFTLPEYDISGDRIFFDYPVYHSDSTPTDYNGNYKLTEGIEIFKDTENWCDSTHYEASLRADRPELAKDIIGNLHGEEEQIFIQKALRLSVKLMLCVAARPGVVEHGQTTRSEKLDHKGVVQQKALWSPNIIGRTYKMPRKFSERAVATGGRAKPRFTFRRGHWTWQAKRLKNQEFVSVEQMPRKPDTNPDPAQVSKVGLIDFDTAGDGLSNKFRACHERIWVEGFLFGDEEEAQNEPLMPLQK